MPECPSCNAPIKDGDWTCGRCGAPVAGAGLPAEPAAGQYAQGQGYGEPAYGGSPAHGAGQWGPENRPQPVGATPVHPPGHRDGLISLVVVAGAVAVIAIVLVWFFALRGPATTGEEFVGGWTATTEQGITTIRVTDAGDAFTVTMTGDQPAQTVTVPAHIDGKDLVITMDDFSQMAGEENAEVFKATLQALAGDFTMVFSSVDSTHLDLRIVGTAPGGQDYDETIPLTRDVAGTL